MTAFSCRLAEPADHAALADLWATESPWSLPPELWETLVLRGPYEPPAIVLAEDVGGVIGQLVLHHTFVQADARVLRGLRPFAAVVAKRWRSTDARALLAKRHPLSGMIEFARDHVEADVVHSIPDPRFARFFAKQPWARVFHYPLWSIPLDGSTIAPPNVSWARCEPGDVPATLCAGGIPEPCHVVRDPASVAWKAAATGQHLVSVHRDGSLVAVVAGRFHGDRQWQIEDVLAYDEHSRVLALAAGVDAGRALRHEFGPGAQKAAVLAPPAVEFAARVLGFRHETYRYAFLTAALGSATVSDDPSQWYVTATD